MPPKSKGWQFDFTELDDILRAVESGAQDVCTGTAYRALRIMQQAVPNVQQSRGYATDALQVSGYVIDPHHSDYESAVELAKTIDGGRIEVRHQIESEFPIHMMPTPVAVIDFPLVYADMIRKGFYHIKARRFVIGVDYIATGMNAVDEDYNQAQENMLASAMNRQARLKLPGF